MGAKPRLADKAMSAPSVRADSRAGKVWGVMRKARKAALCILVESGIKPIIATVRAKVRAPFRVIKRPIPARETRYRRPASTNCQSLSMSVATVRFRRNLSTLAGTRRKACSPPFRMRPLPLVNAPMTKAAERPLALLLMG